MKIEIKEYVSFYNTKKSYSFQYYTKDFGNIWHGIAQSWNEFSIVNKRVRIDTYNHDKEQGVQIRFVN